MEELLAINTDLDEDTLRLYGVAPKRESLDWWADLRTSIEVGVNLDKNRLDDDDSDVLD